MSAAAWLAEPAWRQAEGVAAGEISAQALCAASFERIDALDGALCAYTDQTRERALAAAAAVDRLQASGAPQPPLAGVPFAVKNLFDIRGLATLAGGHRGRAPAAATEDATLVARSLAAGGVLLGALNMDAYAYGFTTENSFHGTTRNPLDEKRVAGGSSGGSGAAVAAGLCSFSLGSDTNGSIRVPSSFCGIFGLKPGYGALSRGGSLPFVHSLDHVGPFARHARDLARVFDQISGRDPRDAACHRDGGTSTEACVVKALAEGLPGLRAARLSGHFDRWADADARAASLSVAQALAASEELDIADVAAARAAAFVITASEAGQLYQPALKAFYRDMEPHNRDRLLAGSLAPASWYVQAQRFRHVFHQRMLAIFERFDLLIAPATPCVATEIGQQWLDLPAGRVAARPSIGLLTQPISLVGLPVVAVPLPTAGKLPIGVQLIAAPGREDIALAAAALIEARGISFVQPWTKVPG